MKRVAWPAFTAILLGISGLAQAQGDLKPLWREVPAPKVNAGLLAFVAAAPTAGTPKVSGYREFELDRGALKSILNAVQAKRPADKGFVPFDTPLDAVSPTRGTISLPAPDGSMLTFAIEDSNTLSAGLAAKHPEIRTFRGIAADGTQSDLRLEVTPSGLHALVRSPARVFYVQPLRFDPAYLEKETRYASFDDNRIQGAVKFRCVTPSQYKSSAQARPAPIPDLKWGDTFRTYRLALASTGYYSKAVGGTQTAALDAIARTIDRVNGIYEREFSIHLELIPEEDQLISLDPAKDHLDNFDPDKLLTESQALIDKLIGDAHYDIGHMLSTGAGGKAQVGAVRRSGVKAMGVTGTDQPTGAFFDVDYVAHEMGHQFGANHTFNGNQPYCDVNRNPPTAYEPGSGSTILGYAGVCGSDNVQPHSDPFFHGISLLEITRYVSGAGETDRRTATGLKFPTLKLEAPTYLPIKTPFYLTAAVVGATPHDGWTYAWEEFDLGPQAPLLAADDGQIPLFRAMPPSAAGTRLFADALPHLARSSTFRVTARQVPANTGILATGGVRLNFVSSSGPFQVVQPNGSALHAGPGQVDWSVARTSEPPVSAMQVRVLLSTDGGASFPVVLAASVPNNGSAHVTFPAQAVPVIVRVESPDHYFFADSKPTTIH
jgi:hypothetical protein